MPGNPLPLLIGVVLTLVTLAVSLRLRRKQRLLSDLPTSKTQGIFVGLVEVCGTAESTAPLSSYLAEAPCIQFAYHIDEEWRRTVTETYTDDKGQTRTRTRIESGWTTVAQDGGMQDFYLQDDTGTVLIRPHGAKIEPQTLVDTTVTPGDPLYYGKGPEMQVADSCHYRRFVEQAIPLHASLYVVGQARERSDLVAPEIAAAKEAPLFLISTRSEKNVQRGTAGWSWFWWALGLVLAGATTFVGANVMISDRFAHNDPAPLIVAGAVAVAVYLGLWAGGWTWMVFNSLIGLRNRVRQAWSLVDVQLKRRHDLIPNLVAIVSSLSSHESSVQTAVATLRTQMNATAPGVAGPDFDGVAGQLRAVVEKYPGLVAQESFAALHRQLVETEQRIALARAYYNDIATHFATRLERVPDRWVAAIVRMQPEPLLNAANFERAPVAVKLADPPIAPARPVRS
ncbi:MAG TPA: LemA family protein [Opitutaceae bacterium]|nr:LemA family protein [Opitutaceae bacterium]